MDRPFPDLSTVQDPADVLPLHVAVLDMLVERLAHPLTAGPIAELTPLEDYSLRHLAKAAGTTRSALVLMRDRCWTDACILTRAVFEQLFAYLWVVQDPGRAEVRSVMVTLKQEWANAKYLEGLAVNAPPGAQARLLAEAARYKGVADALLARLAAELGTTEKKVRDEATLRISAKAIAVNVGPEFSIPYAHYSGFVHSDGNALAAYATPTEAGMTYSLRGLPPVAVPLASDLHRVLLKLVSEIRARCPHVDWPGAEQELRAHAEWLAAAERHSHP